MTAPKSTPQKTSRKLFVNLPVRDLKQSMEFFSKLGFEFNPQFSDSNAACMIINEDAYAMLLVEPYFKTFTKKEISNSHERTEGIFALSCADKTEVDDIVKKAIAGGGKHAMPPVDHGFMYGWSFYDLDDHHWEVLGMDPQAIHA